MNIFFQTFFGTSLSLALGSLLIYLGREWLIARLTESIKHEYSKILFRDKEIWIMKRNACLKGLKLANSILSNSKYENIESSQIVKQYMSIDDARETLDELIVSCEGAEVVSELKKIMFESVSPDAIVDLRKAIRDELDYSKTTVDTDKEKAFIAKLNCINEK